jgi:hypothetical protein
MSFRVFNGNENVEVETILSTNLLAILNANVVLACEYHNICGTFIILKGKLIIEATLGFI